MKVLNRLGILISASVGFAMLVCSLIHIIKTILDKQLSWNNIASQEMFTTLPFVLPISLIIWTSIFYYTKRSAQ